MKKLSIITVCLNEKNKIRETIESVFSQIFRNFEYIIIDGGSTDGTAEIISEYKDKLAYFVSEKDNGIYAAMNKGIKLSSGDYILFLNGGDRLYNSTVLEEIFSAKFDEYIVFGNLMLEEENVIKSFKDIEINDRYLFNNYIPHPSCFIKKSLFDNYGYYDESFKIAGDYEFFLRVIKKYNARTKYISTVVTVYNTNGISSDSKFSILQANERRRAQKKYFSFLFLSTMLILKIKKI